MSLEIGFSVIARRVALAGVIRGKRGHMRSEEGERAMAISALRRRLGVMIVRCQASSLLGRLETLGPGGDAGAGVLELFWWCQIIKVPILANAAKEFHSTLTQFFWTHRHSSNL